MTYHEIDFIEDLAVQKLHRQRNLKEIVALDLLERQFPDQKITNYPNLKNKPELLKIKTRDGEIRDLKCQSEKNDHEKILKSPKIDKEFYKKKYKI